MGYPRWTKQILREIIDVLDDYDLDYEFIDHYDENDYSGNEYHSYDIEINDEDFDSDGVWEDLSDIAYDWGGGIDSCDYQEYHISIPYDD